MKIIPKPEKYISSYPEQKKIILDPIYIIMANDDFNNRQFFKQAFEELDIALSVDILDNGQELMSLFTKKKNVLPHLILLHLKDPHLNEITYLKEIKSNENLNEIPIGIYSENNSESDKIDIFLHGANVYIEKKNTLSELKKALEKVIATTFVYNNPPFNINNFVMTV
jgi:CheY-like chemotaxis protein